MVCSASAARDSLMSDQSSGSAVCQTSFPELPDTTYRNNMPWLTHLQETSVRKIPASEQDPFLQGLTGIGMRLEYYKP